jgi:hypothetical protein
MKALSGRLSKIINIILLHEVVYDYFSFLHCVSAEHYIFNRLASFTEL